MSDSVTNPAHYGGSIECRDALASRLEGTGLAPMAVYWLGCAFKYMSSRMTYLPTGEDITRLLAVGKAISSWNRRVE